MNKNILSIIIIGFLLMGIVSAETGSCSTFDYTDLETCEENIGCTWGYEASCSVFENEHDCGLESGCSWEEHFEYCDGMYMVFDDLCYGSYHYDNSPALITLNSPLDNAILSSLEVTYNSTAENSSSAGILLNMNLYTNETGIWEVKNSSNITDYFSNLVAYYKLDETSGTTAYDSLENYDGINTGLPINQEGYFGTAYTFNGSDTQTYRVETGINLMPKGSISAWIKFNDLSGTQIAIGSGDGSALLLRMGALGTSPYFAIYSNDGSNDSIVASGTILETDIWYHFIAIWGSDVYGSEGMKLYIDNNLVGSATYRGYGYFTGTPIFIGTTTPYLDVINGTIDEVAIFNKDLTSAESYHYSSAVEFEDLTPLFFSTFENTYSDGDTILWNVKFCDVEGICGFADSNRTFSISFVEEETPPAQFSSTGQVIYDSMNSFGSGLGIFMQIMSVALPLLVLGLGVVAVIVIIAWSLVGILKR